MLFVCWTFTFQASNVTDYVQFDTVTTERISAVLSSFWDCL
jgi:hypothetical protein